MYLLVLTNTSKLLPNSYLPKYNLKLNKSTRLIVIIIPNTLKGYLIPERGQFVWTII